MRFLIFNLNFNLNENFSRLSIPYNSEIIRFIFLLIFQICQRNLRHLVCNVYGAEIKLSSVWFSRVARAFLLTSTCALFRSRIISIIWRNEETEGLRSRRRNDILTSRPSLCFFLTITWIQLNWWVAAWFNRAHEKNCNIDDSWFPQVSKSLLI